MEECSLKTFRSVATKTHEAIQEVLRFVPPSLHDHIKQYVGAYERTGTIPLNPEPGKQPDIEWVMKVGLVHIHGAGFSRFETRILFECRYFGGNVIFHPTAGGVHFNGHWIETETSEQLFPSIRQSSLYAIPLFFEEASKAMKMLASDVQNEVWMAIQKCGDDARFLFEEGKTWLHNQRSELKKSEAFNRLIMEARKELPTIIEGLRGTRSFAKSNAIKELRERLEKMYANLSVIEEPEFWKNLYSSSL